MSDAAKAAPETGASTKSSPKKSSGLLAKFKDGFSVEGEADYSLEEYFELCKTDPLAYATPAERLLAAIGEPKTIETRSDPKLSNVFQSRPIQTYEAFDDFYGMEDVVETLVKHIRHAAQGLEESKQILYLLGPVGGGKSSLSDRLVEMMENNPIYVLRHKESGEASPVFENPLGLFDKAQHGKELKSEYGIDPRYIRKYASPWALKRLEEEGGDLSKFDVVKVLPSKVYARAIAQVEPADENNQDVSTIVGKTDIRKLEEFEQRDPDSYSFSGGLNRSNEGIMLFEEMFKAPIKTLSPLLGATQNLNYQGTEEIGPIPYNGMIVANSNEGEWDQFSRDKKNEAFLDRVNIVKVPYTLRATEEVKIYEKLIRGSDLANNAIAPETLEILARFAVMSRLFDNGRDDLHTKMKVYDGENLKATHPDAKSFKDYRKLALKSGESEGMEGISTRWAFKTLSNTFNFASSTEEIAADPIHLFKVLKDRIQDDDQIDSDQKEHYFDIIDSHLKPEYLKFVENEIKKAYLESYDSYGQNIFDRYLAMAQAWLENQEVEDPDTGVMLNRAALDDKLKKIEHPSGIPNATDFRNEVVRFALNHQVKNDGRNPSWSAYEKMREVIEKKMFDNIHDMLPVISFGAKGSSEDQEKHEGYLERMKTRGYTDQQVRRVTDWYVSSYDNS